jgi:hypothetical protein
VRRKRGVPEALPRSGPRGSAPFDQSDVARWGRRLAIQRALRSRPIGAGSDLEALEAGRTVVEWWRGVDRDLSGISHALVGAAASNAYMAPRMTADLDVAVGVRDLAQAEALLTACGYGRLGDLNMSLDPQLTGSRWRTPAGEYVDLIGIGHRWAATAIAEAQEAPWQGLPVMPMPYLVLMKLISSRAVDTADLQRVLGAASHQQWLTVRDLVSRLRPQDLDDLDALRQIGLWERDQVPR